MFPFFGFTEEISLSKKSEEQNSTLWSTQRLGAEHPDRTRKWLGQVPGSCTQI